MGFHLGFGVVSRRVRVQENISQRSCLCSKSLKPNPAGRENCSSEMHAYQTRPCLLGQLLSPTYEKPPAGTQGRSTGETFSRRGCDTRL